MLDRKTNEGKNSHQKNSRECMNHKFITNALALCLTWLGSNSWGRVLPSQYLKRTQLRFLTCRGHIGRSLGPCVRFSCSEIHRAMEHRQGNSVGWNRKWESGVEQNWGCSGTGVEPQQKWKPPLPLLHRNSEQGNQLGGAGLDGRADIFHQISVIGSQTYQSCDSHREWAVKKSKLNIKILWSDLNSLKRLHLTNSDISSQLAAEF